MRLAHIHTKDADNRFNPRICKRCDKNTINYGLVYSITVSIHASVKDATALIYYNDSQINVSIHASVKDATYDTDS